MANNNFFKEISNLIEELQEIADFLQKRLSEVSQEQNPEEIADIKLLLEIIQDTSKEVLPVMEQLHQVPETIYTPENTLDTLIEIIPENNVQETQDDFFQVSPNATPQKKQNASVQQPVQETQDDFFQVSPNATSQKTQNASVQQPVQETQDDFFQVSPNATPQKKQNASVQQPTQETLVQSNNQGTKEIISFPQTNNSIEPKTKEEIKQQLNENMQTIKTSLKSMTSLMKEFVVIVKKEALAYPGKKINEVKDKIETAKYNKARSIVLSELKVQTNNLSKSLNTIQKAGTMLSALENKEIEPPKKKSILKQLRTNKEIIAQKTALTKENKEKGISL